MSRYSSSVTPRWARTGSPRRRSPRRRRGRARRPRRRPSASTADFFETSVGTTVAVRPIARTRSAVSFEPVLEDVGDHDVGAGLGERDRGLAADAARRAGDDRDPAVERERVDEMLIHGTTMCAAPEYRAARDGGALTLPDLRLHGPARGRRARPGCSPRSARRSSRSRTRSRAGRWDILRGMEPFVDERRGIEFGGGFQNHNVEKLGITLNLRTERGKELLAELVRISDVVTENFAAGVLERWGFALRPAARAPPRRRLRLELRLRPHAARTRRSRRGVRSCRPAAA